MQHEQRAATGSIIPTWEKALRDHPTFRELVAPHVRLEGRIFGAPICGREGVWLAIQTAGEITDALRFTYESAATDRYYLEWERAGRPPGVRTQEVAERSAVPPRRRAEAVDLAGARSAHFSMAMGGMSEELESTSVIHRKSPDSPAAVPG
jgi:hypothetical protein